ncbi:MAG: RecX family transcriptional regulator [Candidatus Nomurabacteria bacterium]|jgi:regulatory protein|nr:RecX family transcriptional regulator [Candidatus Nomurabacteria bacterium]
MEQPQKITAITKQAHNANRVNIFVNGRFALALGLTQVVDEKLRVGLALDQARLAELEQQGVFDKYYQRALIYALTRPRSEKEIRDYLRKKTAPVMKRIQNRDGDYEIVTKSGMNSKLIEPIIEKLKTKKYLDDYQFARFWAENRNLKKGISVYQLRQELLKKGISNAIIDDILTTSTRTDVNEIRKIIAKKRTKYDDQKLIAYLVQKGFDYATVLDSVRTDSANPDFDP